MPDRLPPLAKLRFRLLRLEDAVAHWQEAVQSAVTARPVVVWAREPIAITPYRPDPDASSAMYRYGRAGSVMVVRNRIVGRVLVGNKTTRTAYISPLRRQATRAGGMPIMPGANWLSPTYGTDPLYLRVGSVCRRIQ